MKITDVTMLHAEEHTATARVTLEYEMYNRSRTPTKEDFETYIKESEDAYYLRTKWAVLLILLLRHPQHDVLLSTLYEWEKSQELTNDSAAAFEEFMHVMFPKLIKSIE